VKIAAMTLFLCAAAAFANGARAQDEARQVQQRIDQLEDEQSAIKQESFELGRGRTVKDSMASVAYDRDRVTQQIGSLDAAIEQMRTLRDDLAQARAQRADTNIYTREDGREEALQTIGEEVALIGVSAAAKTYAGAVGTAAFVGESLYRYKRKVENVAQLDELLATTDRNLGELRNLRLKFQADRGVHMQKLARLEELRRRDMEVFGELAEAHAQLARLQTPPRAAAAAPKPAPAAPRPTAPRERVIYPMELAGAWTGTGYTCNGAEPDEFIFITFTPEEGLVATKSLGDECVHSTEVTWTGRLEGKVIHGRFHVRARGAPTNADSWIDGTLDVISPNEIRGFGVTFHRPAVR
jgi:hypothetical protein